MKWAAEASNLKLSGPLPSHHSLSFQWDSLCFLNDGFPNKNSTQVYEKTDSLIPYIFLMVIKSCAWSYSETAFSTLNQIMCASDTQEVNFFKMLWTFCLETNHKGIQVKQRTKQDWKQMFKPELENRAATKGKVKEITACEAGEQVRRCFLSLNDSRDVLGGKNSIEKQFCTLETHHTLRSNLNICAPALT